MQEDVSTLKQVVEQYDSNLALKANKQELLGVDNKFRLYAKKDKFKKFEEQTELDCHELKTETKYLN